MSDLGSLLALRAAALAAGEDYVLATVVAVEGSSYRKPGARMLLTAGGQRAGTISGGCLEGEVSRKAWWLTENGPVVRRYSTFYDGDNDIPYGLGCGGVVEVLLERKQTAEPLLGSLASCFAQRLPCSAATVIEGPHTGARYILGVCSSEAVDLAPFPELSVLAAQAAQAQASLWPSMILAGEHARVFAEYIPPRLGLFLFGAGDDAQPLVELARTQGWYTAVADGRAHLATRDRFPLADQIEILRDGAIANLDLRATDAAVLLTHSYEQDRMLLRALLPPGLRYLGVLGPKVRTRRLVEELAPELGLTVESCMARLRSPVGLAIQAESPAAIALSITAEIEAVSHQPWLQERVSQHVAAPWQLQQHAPSFAR